MSEYNFTTGKNILFELPQDQPDLDFGPGNFGRDNTNYYISTVGGLYIGGKNNMQPYLVKVDRKFVVDKESGEPIEFSKSNPYIPEFDPKGVGFHTLTFYWNDDYEKYVLEIENQ